MFLTYRVIADTRFQVNYASVMGLLSDTNMQTNQFSDLTLAFYVTYLFFELPTGYLMQRWPTAKYLGFNGILRLRHLQRKGILTQSSHSMGPHDDIELHCEELWGFDDPPCVVGLLRERNCSSVSSIAKSTQKPSNKKPD